AVDRAGLERLATRVRVVDDAEDDIRDIALLAPVVLIGGELDLRAGVPRREGEGTRAGRVLGAIRGDARGLLRAADVVGAVLLEGGRALHRERRERQGGDEPGPGLRQVHDGLVVA